MNIIFYLAFFISIPTVIFTLAAKLVKNDREDIEKYLNTLKTKKCSKTNGKLVKEWYLEVISKNKENPKRTYLTKSEQNFVENFLEDSETTYPFYEFTNKTNEMTDSLSKIGKLFLHLIAIAVKTIATLYGATVVLAL